MTTDQAPAVNRKSRVGTVVSDKNDKTVIVSVARAKRHRLYHKVIRSTKRYQVHDPDNRATTGDMVRIEECRPISKLKRWQLVEVLTERDVAEVAAAEIDRSLVQEVQRSAAHTADAESADGRPAAAALAPTVIAPAAATAAPAEAPAEVTASEAATAAAPEAPAEAAAPETASEATASETPPEGGAVA
jgi:small subunit ribosomal protein S17